MRWWKVFGLPAGVSKGIDRPVTKTAPKNPPPRTPRPYTPNLEALIDRLMTAYDKGNLEGHPEIEGAIRQIRDFGR